ncbi:MAG: conjugal transfer protein TraB [Deltaproteobacteria bacterium]|nr:conjugal transfer protein TraB [Deltaproteobacteria bacterium]
METEKVAPEKKNQLIIPSSTFMEGVLLSGVHAPCTSFGKEEPTIMIIKIQKPAILPNDVKANLKGCFVQVEGVCQLSTERVKTRLRRISCMSKESASVIDQQIKGYVTDEDGILGLKGRVVAKFSDALSRTFFAELISGLGRGTSESMTTTTTSSVTGEESATVDPKNIGMVGLGRGLEGAGSMVSKFYLDLAKQMVPAMEIGAMKKLHVVITEPVVLKVSEFE